MIKYHYFYTTFSIKKAGRNRYEAEIKKLKIL
jgi:hypothetical protein